MATHLMDVASTDQHTVKPWFAGKLDFSPAVPDFAADGFPLVGGRLDYVDHRPVAALVYMRRKHVINVFEWPEAGGDRAAHRVAPRTERGYHVVRADTDGLACWFVSDLNADELAGFARLVAAPGAAQRMITNLPRSVPSRDSTLNR
jgi:anti-sigma factor RsiW